MKTINTTTVTAELFARTPVNYNIRLADFVTAAADVLAQDYPRISASMKTDASKRKALVKWLPLISKAAAREPLYDSKRVAWIASSSKHPSGFAYGLSGQEARCILVIGNTAADVYDFLPAAETLAYYKSMQVKIYDATSTICRIKDLSGGVRRRVLKAANRKGLRLKDVEDFHVILDNNNHVYLL